jgi:ribonuclease PH
VEETGTISTSEHEFLGLTLSKQISSCTVAQVRGCLLVDPTMMEESAADCVISAVFGDGQMYGLVETGRVNKEQLKTIFKIIQTKQATSNQPL